MDFEAVTTGKILKKHIFLSKNIVEMVRLQYHFSKIDFRGFPEVLIENY